MFKLLVLLVLFGTFNFSPIGNFIPDRLIVVKAHGCLDPYWPSPCTPDTTWPGGSPLTIYHVLFHGDSGQVWGAIDPALAYYVPIGLIEWCSNLDFFGSVTELSNTQHLFRECP